MSFYQIDSTRLRAKKDELTQLLARFRQEKELLGERENALRGMWEGEANESFHALFARNAGQMDAFAELVSSYIDVIARIADRYDIAERNNVGRATI